MSHCQTLDSTSVTLLIPLEMLKHPSQSMQLMVCAIKCIFIYCTFKIIYIMHTYIAPITLFVVMTFYYLLQEHEIDIKNVTI